MRRPRTFHIAIAAALAVLVSSAVGPAYRGPISTGVSIESDIAEGRTLVGPAGAEGAQPSADTFVRAVARSLDVQSDLVSPAPEPSGWGQFPGPGAYDPTTGQFLVTDLGTRQLDVLDPGGDLVGTIATDALPLAVAYSAVGPELFVWAGVGGTWGDGMSNSSALLEFNAATYVLEGQRNVSTSVPYGVGAFVGAPPTPTSILLSPNGTEVIILLPWNQLLAFWVDPISLAWSTTLTAGTYGQEGLESGAVYDAAAGGVLVTNGSNLTELSPQNGSTMGELSPSTGILSGLALDPVSRTLWTFNASDVLELSAESGAVEAAAQGPGSSGGYGYDRMSGGGMLALAFVPDSGAVVAAVSQYPTGMQQPVFPDQVYLINATNATVLGSLPSSGTGGPPMIESGTPTVLVPLGDNDFAELINTSSGVSFDGLPMLGGAQLGGFDALTGEEYLGQSLSSLVGPRGEVLGWNVGNGSLRSLGWFVGPSAGPMVNAIPALGMVEVNMGGDYLNEVNASTGSPIANLSLPFPAAVTFSGATFPNTVESLWPLGPSSSFAVLEDAASDLTVVAPSGAVVAYVAPADATSRVPVQWFFDAALDEFIVVTSECLEACAASDSVGAWSLETGRFVWGTNVSGWLLGGVVDPTRGELVLGDDDEGGVAPVGVNLTTGVPIQGPEFNPAPVASAPFLFDGATFDPAIGSAVFELGQDPARVYALNDQNLAVLWATTGPTGDRAGEVDGLLGYDPTSFGILETSDYANGSAGSNSGGDLYWTAPPAEALVQNISTSYAPAALSDDPPTGDLFVATLPAGTVLALSGLDGPGLAGRIVPWTDNGTAALNLSWSVQLTGGNAPFSYSYRGLPPGCASVDAPTVTCTVFQPGPYYANATVTDAWGASIVLTGAVTAGVSTPIPTPSPAGGPLGLPLWSWLVIGLATGLVLGGLLWWRGRRRT